MSAARITKTSEGRLILTEIIPVNGKSICLELHRADTKISFLLLTIDEFDLLREDIAAFALSQVKGPA